MFSSIMDKETALSYAEKISYLTDAIKSKESRELMQRAASITNVYIEVAVEQRKRYDKCKVVYIHHVNSTLSRGAVH